jgi:SAM-dependent methyltransferase
MKQVEASYIDPGKLQAVLGRHLALYRSRTPYYQATMLDSILDLWQGRHERLLDIGGGTGVIAQAVSELFPVAHVEAIDVVDRFCPTLSILARTYDGLALPYEDGRFDAAMLNNVLHHVPINSRADMLREIRRVVNGPIYIKDHEAQSSLDHLRLLTLDAIGNIPFSGMVSAQYLCPADWEALASASGYRIAARTTVRPYRSGPYALLFPNRLETTMRFEAA